MKVLYASICIISFVTLHSMAMGQDPTLYFNFEPSGSSQIKNIASKEEAVYVVDLQEPAYVKGINGMALDLSEDAILRSPLILEGNNVPSYDKSSSFSIQISYSPFSFSHRR